MRRTRAAAAVAALLLLTASVGSQQPAKEEKGELRKQAVLRVVGDVPAGGSGFVVEEVTPGGPAAKLELVGGAGPKTGSLAKGDVITEVEGKKFYSRRELLDLLNEAHRMNNGTVKITVKGAKTGQSVVWVARPVEVELEVPPLLAGFLDQLGKPVPAAPGPPTVPPTIDP